MLRNKISDSDSILIIKPEWLNKILDGEKDLEIRRQPCTSKKGKRIWLAASGASEVWGSAVVKDCLGPLSTTQWDHLRLRHRVAGERVYGSCTYAYELVDVQKLEHAIRIQRKRGSIGFQTGSGLM